ncbi:MAG: hypothetical protein ACK4NF_05575, partial [Planctomycetota bacterium]
AEVIYILSKDLSLRKKATELRINDYIITPFYRKLYEKMVNNDEPLDLMDTGQVDEDYNKYLPYLCKFEYMDYEITASKLSEVLDNLKALSLRKTIYQESAQLEKIIELKKELFGLLT